MPLFMDSTEYLYIELSIGLEEGARGVTVITIESKLGYPSSNPKQGCLHFT